MLRTASARVFSALRPRAAPATSGTLLRRRALAAAAASTSTLAAAASWALCEPTGAQGTDDRRSELQSANPATADYLKKADFLRDNTPEENMEALNVWKGHIQAAREQFSRKEFDLAEESLKAALEAAKVFGRDSGAHATSLLNLAQLYRRRRKLAEAVLHLKSA